MESKIKICILGNETFNDTSQWENVISKNSNVIKMASDQFMCL